MMRDKTPKQLKKITTVLSVMLSIGVGADPMNSVQAAEMTCTLYAVGTQYANGGHSDSIQCQNSTGLSYEITGQHEEIQNQFIKATTEIDAKLTKTLSAFARNNSSPKPQINAAKSRFFKQLKDVAHPQFKINNHEITQDKIIIKAHSQWSISWDETAMDVQLNNLNVAETSMLLAAQQGANERTALVIHVTANDFSTEATPAELSNAVFGTTGDPVNMVSQFDDCSYGQLSMLPAQGTNIVNGVVELSIDMNIEGVAQGTVRNAVTTAGNNLFGNLYAQADHIMFALPPNTAGNWIAFASVNGSYSTYNNDWATYVSAQMHELGHNFGMGHSGSGNNEYNDKSGMMGFSYSNNDGPKMCFNSVKSSKFGWYNDKEITFFESDWNLGQNTWRGKVVGISNYNQMNSDQHALIKIHSVDNDDSSPSLHVNFNRDTGINSGTRAGKDKVMVASTERPRGYNTSLVEATLNGGESKTFPNFWSNEKDLKITVLEIETNSDGVMFADVEISVDFNVGDLIFSDDFE